MTSIPVNNVNALTNYINQAGNASGRTDEAKTGDFQQAMNQANRGGNMVQAENAGRTAAQNVTPAGQTSTQKTATDNDTRKTTDSTDNKMQKDTGNNAVKDADSTKSQEKIQESGKKLVEEVAEEMDVTEEEVVAAMEILGMTAMDLLNPDNMKQLLMELSGNSDEISLVTNEGLYTNLQNLLGAVEETLDNLAQELGISEEELTGLIEQMASEADADEVVETPQEAPEVNLEGMKDYNVSVTKDGETVQVKVEVDDASGNKTVQQEVVEPQHLTEQTQDKPAGRQNFEENKGQEHNGNFLQQMTAARNNTMADSITPETTYQSAQNVQTEEITNQILEYMRIHIKADTQEMEMQLHPASLGTVNVQLTAKDGAITAQFTTQNEMVRAAVESQLIQLKEQFEEQGIKVDAVEVTVASHQDGQQFTQNGEEMQQDNQKSGKASRRINLDDLEEEEGLEEMEDSERIAVEMMRQNGNSIDYMA